MDIESIKSMLFRIENEIPIEGWTVEGVHIYPIIRFMFIERLLGTTQNFMEESLPTPLEGICNTIRFIKTDKSLNQNIKSNKNIVIVGRNKLRQSSMIYNIQTAFPNSLFLEYEPTLEYQYPRFSPSKLIQLRLFWFKLQSKLRVNWTELKHSFPEFTEFILRIKAYGFNSEDFTKEKILYQSILTLRIADFYEKILRQNPIDYAIVIPYYLPEGMAMCLACNRVNIPCADIQHGLVIGNIGYDFWDSIPEEPYELLPTHFFVWKKQDADCILKWTKRNNVFIGGNISMGVYENLETLKDKVDIRTHILVTLQPSFDPEVIFNAIDKADPDNFFWWIRCHPSMGHNIVEQLDIKFGIKGNCDVRIATSKPLLTMLNTADVHVTGFSSVIMEAETCGIPSISVDPNAIRRYPHLVENSSLITTITEKELVKELNKIHEQYQKPTFNTPVKYNPIENIKMFDFFIREFSH